MATKPRSGGGKSIETALNLFADFNGVPDDDARIELYQHDPNWTNRLIMGDSLEVTASLAEREGLRGQVQYIYSIRRTASNSTRAEGIVFVRKVC